MKTELKIGDRIAIKRKQLGLSQEDLAKKMGYKSRSTINKIELNINDVTQTKVVEFARALDTSVAFLMGWEENEPIPEDELSPAKEELIEIIKSLSEEEVQAVLRLLKR